MSGLLPNDRIPADHGGVVARIEENDRCYYADSYV